jgi:hypothetical protein
MERPIRSKFRRKEDAITHYITLAAFILGLFSGVGFAIAVATIGR